jgi:hypothetical protein
VTGLVGPFEEDFGLGIFPSLTTSWILIKRSVYARDVFGVCALSSYCH